MLFDSLGSARAGLILLGFTTGLWSCADADSDLFDPPSSGGYAAPAGHLAHAVEAIGHRSADSRREQVAAAPHGSRAHADELALARAAPSGETSQALPGKVARTIVDQQVDEAENLFFTDDGRLFVSSNHDIFEFKQSPDGKFEKRDHFHEECVVEGIVESRGYLYGVCWRLKGLTLQSYFIAGELTRDPTFRIIADLEREGIPNGMTVDPAGRIYAADSINNEIVRWTLAAPLELAREEIWIRHAGVNGLKYVDGSIYTSRLDPSLVSYLDRIPMRSDGSAGTPERLYSRALTVLDDIEPFDGGFVITDFLAGTLIFWDPQRGVYGETPRKTFYGPSAVAIGQPPMFTERQLLVTEKGNFLILGETQGDLLSTYQLE